MLQSLCSCRTYHLPLLVALGSFFIILLDIFREQDIQRLKNHLMMCVALKIQVPGIKRETQEIYKHVKGSIPAEFFHN